MIESPSPEGSELQSHYKAIWERSTAHIDRIQLFLAGYPHKDTDGHYCELVSQLATYDLMLAWSNWAIELERGGRLLTDTQILSMFEALPTANTYEPLFCERCRNTSRWDKVVDGEAEARTAFGDAIGSTYFRETYGRIPQPRAGKSRTLTVQFDSRVVQAAPANLIVHLQGQVDIGRQAEDSLAVGSVETRRGVQVFIAPREDRMISRRQLVIRLLTPNCVLISNVSQSPRLPEPAFGSLLPGKSQLVSFPFMITLPGRKLLGD